MSLKTTKKAAMKWSSITRINISVWTVKRCHIFTFNGAWQAISFWIGCLNNSSQYHSHLRVIKCSHHLSIIARKQKVLIHRLMSGCPTLLSCWHELNRNRGDPNMFGVLKALSNILSWDTTLDSRFAMGDYQVSCVPFMAFMRLNHNII